MEQLRIHEVRRRKKTVKIVVQLILYLSIIPITHSIMFHSRKLDPLFDACQFYSKPNAENFQKLLINNFFFSGRFNQLFEDTSQNIPFQLVNHVPFKNKSIPFFKWTNMFLWSVFFVAKYEVKLVFESRLSPDDKGSLSWRVVLFHFVNILNYI